MNEEAVSSHRLHRRVRVSGKVSQWWRDVVKMGERGGRKKVAVLHV